MSNSQSGQGAVSNILAVAGFIILIAIIVWGAYHFLELASSGISSLFTTKDEIRVALSKNTVQSGEAIDMSWTHAPNSAGVYTMIFQCQEGTQMRSVSGSGIVTAIPCGAAFPLGNEATKGARIIPSITGDKSLSSNITVIFNPVIDSTSTSTAASPRPQGSAKVVIQPAVAGGTGTAATAGVKPTEPKPATPETPVTTVMPPKPKPAGTPDLEVRVLAVGVIDPYTGGFVSRAPVSPEEMVAVKFDVVNRGSAATGAWYFSAELPTYPAAAPYNSPRQASLSPGSHIENTLRFNQVPSQGGRFAVSVDSSNAVRESSEKNNDAAIWVAGLTTGYPYAY